MTIIRLNVYIRIRYRLRQTLTIDKKFEIPLSYGYKMHLKFSESISTLVLHNLWNLSRIAFTCLTWKRLSGIVQP